MAGEALTRHGEKLDLSAQARSVWGKTNRRDDTEWLPLYAHMADSAAMVSRIWDEWLPEGTKAVIARNLGDDAILARKVAMFLAGVHDIGKATPVFQSKPIRFAPGTEGKDSLAWKPQKAGLPIKTYKDTSKPTHPIAGEVILEWFLQGKACGWMQHDARSYACIIGGHHGTPPAYGALSEAPLMWDDRIGLDREEWRAVHNELIRFALTNAGLDDADLYTLGDMPLIPQSEVLLTGLTIMADWLASDSSPDMFPLVPLISDAPTDARNMTKNGLDIESPQGLRARAERAWKHVDLPAPWQPESPRVDAGLISERFHLPAGATPRPMQSETVRIAEQTENPGLMVIEAPMGEGKTEAALAAAEVLARRTGRGGVCVALPTMATTDAMFGRVHAWLDALPHTESAPEKTIWLAHGKAQLNEEFQGIIADSHRGLSSIDGDAAGTGLAAGAQRDLTMSVSPETVVSDWLWGRKKGALANFLVCTVDQVLMGALQMKHVVLRQLAMANKVVIIDECHAYDAYMQEYLKDMLGWLGGYRTPVILLSATLPEAIRRELIEAYLGGWQASEHVAAERPATVAGAASDMEDDEEPDAYPRISYTSGLECHATGVEPSGRTLDVHCELMPDDDESLVGLVERLLSEGGCLGVMCDTVGRAQRAAELLAERLEDVPVKLTHSRFIDLDRMENEKELRGLLGPQSTVGEDTRPERLVVVGTQVLEQSLDIDFDALITDLAPTDLLMQRLGRVHRHRRGDGEADRPHFLRQARCYVRGVEEMAEEGPRFADGIGIVYEKAALLEALAVLGFARFGDGRMLHLPEDIASLVRTAYDEDAVRPLIPAGWTSQYGDACEASRQTKEKKEHRAGAYLMKTVRSMVRNDDSLVDWFAPLVDDGDDDRGQRAVRDTQETVEIMVLRQTADGVALLPWVGDVSRGVEPGESLPTDMEPGYAEAMLAAQSVVRLPVALCRVDQLDGLIRELENGCVEEVGAWQETPCLAGRLAVFFKEEAYGVLRANVHGYELSYTRSNGLEYRRKRDNGDAQ